MASLGVISRVIGCHATNEWEEQVQRGIDSKKLVVVCFMSKWCGPCRVIAPTFDYFSQFAPLDIFLKVDVDDLKDVSEKFEVKAMPTFLFMKEGKVVDRFVGANKQALDDGIRKYFTRSEITF